MKPLCEIIALEILPAVRAMVARKLIVNYGLSQKQAAERLGISQPAISQYKREIRGYKTDFFKENPELVEMVNSIAKKLASGEIDNLQSTFEFCRICKSIRFEGAGCQLHRKLDPSLETCAVCMENREFYGGSRKRTRKTKKETGLKPLSKF